MQTISEIRALVEERGLRPRQRWGQNFLHDKNQLGKLVAAAELQPGQLVLEVGPGTGTLTEALLDAGAEVVACEIDAGLAQIVEDRLGDRLTLIRGDCLERGRRPAPAIVEAVGGRRFKLVANLPYQVASPLMVALLLDHPNCAGQYVTIQKEVGDRLLALPGVKAYGALGVMVQVFAEVRRIGTVGPACFWPQPKVTSAMVAIVPRGLAGGDETGRGMAGVGDSSFRTAGHSPGEGGEKKGSASRRESGDEGWTDRFSSAEARHSFARFVTGLFSKRRKQLGAIFGRDRGWPDGIVAEQRPEALKPGQIVALWKSVEAME